jgi:hypothetical protein
VSQSRGVKGGIASWGPSVLGRVGGVQEDIPYAAFTYHINAQPTTLILMINTTRTEDALFAVKES